MNGRRLRVIGQADVTPLRGWFAAKQAHVRDA